MSQGGKQHRQHRQQQQRRRQGLPVSSHTAAQRPPLYRRVATALAPAANANVLACLLGIFVGVIPPLRAALFEPTGYLFIFADAIKILSNAALPQAREGGFAHVVPPFLNCLA